MDRTLLGDKAFGLAQLHSEFLVPPFVVLTSECWARGRPDREFLSALAGSGWVEIERVLRELFRGAPFGVIVRPSVVNEPMNARGTTRSTVVRNVDLPALLRVIQESFAAHESVRPFGLIVQRLVDGRRGHLSNEFHVSRQPEEWNVELELNSFDDSHEPSVDVFRASDPLPESSPKYHQTMRSLATVYSPTSDRHHFEWVIDGDGVLWIVQSDTIPPTPLRALPGQYWLDRTTAPLGTLVSPLRRPGGDDHTRYPKLRPHARFREAAADVTPFALLDDPVTWVELLAGRVPPSVEGALRTLIDGGPISIRVDLPGDEPEKNLPRTDTVLTWSQCEKFLTEKLLADVRLRAPSLPTLLIHRFIAARACAFAFCGPQQTEVVIDSTFGQADGLSMYPHDTAVVAAGGHIRRTTRCKTKYLEAHEDGEWFEQETASELLWAEAVTSEQLLEIARVTTSVARNDKGQVLVMFFVGVPREIAPSGVLPWIAERGPSRTGDDEYASHTRGIAGLVVVRELADFDRVLALDPRPPRVRLVPSPKIVRNTQQLTEISAAAAKANISLVWEGSRLAHGWYALEKGGASVLTLGETSHRQARPSPDLVFNKLVRDGIPTKIQRHGERPITARAVGDMLRVLLQQKLVEEAIEVFAASDRSSLIEELADVEEVLLALREHNQIESAEVEAVREQKRRSRGGFADGIVLRQTTDPPDSHQLISDDRAESTVSPESLRQLTDSRPHQVSPTAILVPRVPPFGAIDGTAPLFSVRILGRTVSVAQEPKGVTVSLSAPVKGQSDASDQLTLDADLGTTLVSSSSKETG